MLTANKLCKLELSSQIRLMFAAVFSEMYYARRFVNAYETARAGFARAGFARAETL